MRITQRRGEEAQGLYSLGRLTQGVQSLGFGFVSAVFA
jgi:hypothetical protein